MIACLLGNSYRLLAVLLVFNSAQFLNGLTKFMLQHIVGKRRFLAFQSCVTQANLSLVLYFKGRATIIARLVSEKERSESILYIRLVLIDFNAILELV